MSAVVGNNEGGQEVELNLAPIIDCLTVLITFMLASATFLSIGILDAGVASAGNTTSTATPPAVNYALELSKDHKLTLKITGKVNTTRSIQAKGGEWDFGGLTQELTALKGKWPDVNAITMIAEEEVEYKDIVKTMEVTRKSLPAVLLGGF